MDQQSFLDEVVFRTNQRRACMEARLVLESAAISAEVVQQDGWWLVVVDSSDREASLAELEAYGRDSEEQAAGETLPVAIYGGGFAGAIFYAVILTLVDFYVRADTFGLPWLAAGQMRADDVMSGQWSRVVTALTLHADGQHLLSNLAFGCVFGLMAGRILGGGIAWLAIVIAGALGNLMNAMMREADHTSIGASTAVFAALGVMVAHALRPRSSTEEKLMKRWSPLIGGVLLLAFIGVGGERTDVGAHVTGFLGGLAIGWLGCRVPTHWLSSRNVQLFAGLASVGVVITAWVFAFLD